MFHCKSNNCHICYQISILFHFFFKSSFEWNILERNYSSKELYFFSIPVLPLMYLRRQKKKKRVSLFPIKLSYKLCYAVFLMLAPFYFITLKSHSICIWKHDFWKCHFHFISSISFSFCLFLSIIFFIVTVVYFSKTTFDFSQLYSGIFPLHL